MKIDTQSKFPAKPSKHVFSFEDARRLAKRRLPRLIFDFVEGAAGREVAATCNVSDFDRIKLQPRVMGDIAQRSLATPLLGQSFDLPFGIAPMGMCNLSRPGADRLMALAARRHNIPVCLSSAASSSIEDMRGWAQDQAWFQLYVGQSVDLSLDLVTRAQRAGYETLILTVDVPQVSRRVRDHRNGFNMPFRLGPKQFLDFAAHPRWSFSTLLHGAPEPRNFPAQKGAAKFDRSASRAGADWAFLQHLRSVWSGKLIVKGVCSVADAQRIRESGADAIYVSNHGGRQLDSAPPAIRVLPLIRAAVGPSFPLLFDSGVRSGEDIVKALALGADYVMLGRAALFALAADGARGLQALISFLAEDISIAMAQIGVTQIADIDARVLFGPESAPDDAAAGTIRLTSKQA
ncbi:MAG: alpha-hydroxy acid oxidase [Pseudomonadota bacterium]